MKVAAVEIIESYFSPVLGLSPWRARLGFGGFLTLDLGAHREDVDRYFGEWHLWVNRCHWKLESRERLIVDSESRRRLIELAIENLENRALVFVEHEFPTGTFFFGFEGDVRLTCFPYEDKAVDDEHWFWFMPGKQVLVVGPGGRVEITASAEIRPEFAQKVKLEREELEKRLAIAASKPERHGTVRHSEYGHRK